jgi:putative aminopeptidase FrvX
MKLLKQLCEVRAPSGGEGPLRDFILSYIRKHSTGWKVQPELHMGDHLQDCVVLVFGKPRTAIYAHMDTVGFMVRYDNQLLPVGSPDCEAGCVLVGEDSRGNIRCELEYDKEQHAFYRFGRSIDRGTTLTYEVNFRTKGRYIESAYLDNRLGVYSALKVAETLTDGILCFSCWEEHGGGSVPVLAQYLTHHWNIRQALICDITWVSDGIEHGKGVVVSLRDRNIPRRAFLDRIVTWARKSKVPFQLEVEGGGSSDGRELQTSPYPIDWCFIGAPEQHAHTPHEKVHKSDIDSMIRLYEYLMKKL